MKIHAVGKPEVPALEVGTRMRNEVVYYAADSKSAGVPPLPDGEYWITADEARQILDDGVVRVASPLRAENAAEIEISEDAERLLEWALEYEVQHITFNV